MKGKGNLNKKYYHFKLTEYENDMIKCIRKFKTYKTLIDYLPIDISRQRLHYYMKKTRENRKILKDYIIEKIKEPTFIIQYYA
tara:strand:- start:3 stop:251 length:249 start_codon:yes stop_codon:yes gene_type:complete